MKFISKLTIFLIINFYFGVALADSVSPAKAKQIVENGKLVSLIDSNEGNNWFKTYNLYLLKGEYYVCKIEVDRDGYKISCNKPTPPKFTNWQ